MEQSKLSTKLHAPSYPQSINWTTNLSWSLTETRQWDTDWAQVMPMRSISTFILKRQTELLDGNRWTLMWLRSGTLTLMKVRESLLQHQHTNHSKDRTFHCSTMAKSSSRMWISQTWPFWQARTLHQWVCTLWTAWQDRCFSTSTDRVWTWTTQWTWPTTKTTCWSHFTTTGTNFMKSGLSNNINKRSSPLLWTCTSYHKHRIKNYL